jgi:hypothetical protein
MIIASCALSTSYIIAFHFTSVLNIYREAHDIKNFSNNLKFSTQQDTEINIILQSLLDNTKSNRAYIFRYHNGLASVHGVPFFFHTVTHEVISPGTTRVMQFEQHIPASINIAMNNQFMQNKCAIVRNADDDKDSQNYWYYQIRAAKSLIRCPIFMNNGDLFGFVGIDYLNDTPSELLNEAVLKVRNAALQLPILFSKK